MNFTEFKSQVERHPYLSVVLIVLFSLSVVDQSIKYTKGIWSVLVRNQNFEITRLEISRRHSVYYEWGKLSEKSKLRKRKTQFSDERYRQFRYDENYVDSFGLSLGRGLMTAIFVIQYAVSKLELPQDVHDQFNCFLQWTLGSKAQFRSFIYELIPVSRFRYVDGTNRLIPFIQGNDSIHKYFLHSLQSLHDNPVSFQFFDHMNRPVRQARVESLVRDHFALFNGSFLPVFEVYLQNNSKKAVTIDKIGVEVIRIKEYRGGAEAIPASKINTIPVEYKKGMNMRRLDGDEQVYLKADSDARILLRLEPKDKFSSYLVQIHIYAANVSRETEIFALDM